MNQIAIFKKVSYEQFASDVVPLSLDDMPLSHVDNICSLGVTYENIRLPIRATFGSAGYDFYSPFDITINPGETALIPTGIRCWINEGDWVLMIFPRSSLGFKYQLCLANTVGIIDSDYYYAKNEGHIMIKLVNRGDEAVKIKAGDRFVQGIFLPYGVTINDDVTAVRTGGFGSTN